MTTSTTPTDAQSNSTALIESQPIKKSSILFLTPQVASYFVGELLCVLAGKRIGMMTPFIFHSWRMCRSCLADGRQPAGTAEDHPVRFPLIFIHGLFLMHVVPQTSTAYGIRFTIQGRLEEPC